MPEEKSDSSEARPLWLNEFGGHVNACTAMAIGPDSDFKSENLVELERNLRYWADWVDFMIRHMHWPPAKKDCPLCEHRSELDTQLLMTHPKQ